MTGVQTCALPISFANGDDTHIRKEVVQAEAAELWANALARKGWARLKSGVSLPPQVDTLAGDLSASLPPAFSSTGTPEGKVAAPVGSVYTDTAATNGAIRWIKTSGTGNTGWRVEYGDTGWRLYDSVAGGIKSGRVLIRRKESKVFIHFERMTPESTGTNISLGRFPVGFRGADLTNRWVMLNGATAVPDFYTGNVSTLGYVNIYGPFSNAPELTGTADYLTDEPWPSSLPGTPA